MGVSFIWDRKNIYLPLLKAPENNEQSAPTFFILWLILRLITFIGVSRHSYRYYDDMLYSAYQRFVLFFFESWSQVKIYFHGDYEEIFRRKENVLYISNHQSSVDWIIVNMLAVRQGSLGHIRYVLKSDLKRIPFYGFYFEQHGCIYVHRTDKKDLDRVEKGMRQIERNGLPVWLVVFPEGTRYNPEKNPDIIERSRQFAEKKGNETKRNANHHHPHALNRFAGVSPLINHLYPRMGATVAAINALKDKLDAVYDITAMYYPTYDNRRRVRLGASSMIEYLQGKTKELHIHIKRIPINSVPSESNEQISDWLYQRFLIKDKLLEHFYDPNRNDSHFDSNGKSVRAQSSFNLTIFAAIFFLLSTFLLVIIPQCRSFYVKMISSPSHVGNDEDDKCVPRAAVHKMIKDRTRQIRVSSDAKEFFVQCCNEFIHTLALQANTVCEQQTKKLVHPDHVITALEKLGFASYRSNCLDAMNTAQTEMAQKRRKLHGKSTSIYTDEELRQQQELLFQQAREEAQQLEEDDWTQTQEMSKEVLRKKIEASRTDDDNYDD
ncbi:unnamed protein product [Adineta ricciae]|uniref:Phospholipid/glycerol acyltransferase domain-containing protein n=1 Tax=Adineta ricciae TaxID=249248 RepID=A0A814FDU9_ADIRI|nr:unnamed protein product [Adineta ricciae]